MLRKLFLFAVIITISISGCDKFSKYPGYSKASSGIYYKLSELGDQSKRIQPNDYITIDIQYKTINDSLFFKGRRKLQVTEPEFKGSIDECFLMLYKDESASFIISVDDFFSKTLEATIPGFLQGDDKMKVNVDVIDVQSEQEYLHAKEAFLTWIEDFGEYEKVILKQFIEEKDISIEPTNSGLYHIILREGYGPIVELGDTVTVHFEGKFLNGKFFDSTIRRNQPFQFVYGRKWQVVAGLEEAIGRMKEGEHALFILPSDLAFGETGSSTGIIPPYTSTIFEVELIEVIKGVKTESDELNKYDEN